MKKIMSLLLIAVLVLSMAACGNNPDTPSTGDTTPSTDATTEATEPSTEVTEPSTEDTTPVVSENAVTSLTLSINENWEPVTSIYIGDNGDGTVFVQYMGEYRKQDYAYTGTILADITTALSTLDLTTLGESVYGDGTTTGGLSINYADGTYFQYDYWGDTLPDVFMSIFNALDAAVQTSLADMEIYVPQAMVGEGIDETVLNEMQSILNNTGIDTLDQFFINNIALDEYFAYTAGLSGTEGIANGTTCAPMMMTTPYSLVIVTLAEGTDAAAVAADFETSLDWMKWVCVNPTNALIAQKDNMVLCLVAADSLYNDTAAAVTTAGWTTVNELTNPNM